MGMWKSGRIVAAAALFFMLSILFVTGSYAGNGTRSIGFSSRDGAMAGATTASAEDTSCLVRNPAGLVRIGNRIDAEYASVMPRDVSMRTEGAPLSLANPSRIQKSTIDYLPAGNAAISYRIPGTDAHPVSVGVGMFTMAGVAVDFPSSRINELLTGNGVYDKMIDIRSMRIAPGIAVALTDKLSFGATANIAVQGLRTDIAQSNLQETSGAGKWDFAPGGGFTLGLLYEVNDMLSLGASYESQTKMVHHYKYKDVLPYLDEPSVVNAGLSFKPIKQLELTYDTRYINWTNIKFAGLSPVAGGFGWRDQWVFATGGEYNFKDKLKLRLGYNYGRSPIQPHVVFANAILPLIMEHHLTTGFSYYLTKNLSLDFVWEHHFTGVMADDGSGDIYSQNGVGTKITCGADILGVGLGYQF